ncbi:putative nucleoporin Nup54 [Chionoecetes opilio]|uniref:Putative nucleoporin Nup54 n=1 Tax=Chionoecetes opilio TaxID=41210 RepID=A0A8J5CV01_CHIOP|nr:putative nucleoporin Nup54 [Chionoecetes opilio]
MNTTLHEITQPRHKHTMVKAAIQEAEWKQANLTRRVLKLVSAQEIERKRGIPLDQTEEQIRMRLEDLYMQLMQPTQYREYPLLHSTGVYYFITISPPLLLYEYPLLHSTGVYYFITISPPLLL